MYMTARPDSLAKFQKLYFEEFGEQLSDGDALDRLTRLTNVLRVLFSSPFTDFHEQVERPQVPFDGHRESDTLNS
jgi:hypothetical protein